MQCHKGEGDLTAGLVIYEALILHTHFEKREGFFNLIYTADQAQVGLTSKQERDKITDKETN